LGALSTIREEFSTFDLHGRLIFLGEMGSTSHGTSSEDTDDYDLMGVVVPPARYSIGLSLWEHWVRPPGDDGLDVVLYLLRKYTRLLLKSNPNVMGLLWLRPEHMVLAGPEWDLLHRNRDAFSSRQAYRSFVGYAHAQLRKMEKGAYRGYMGEKRKAMVQQFGYDTKNAAHLIRLLRMGIEFLTDGEMRVYRPDREELKAIKRGEWTLERVKEEANQLFAEAGQAYEHSPLPDEPDHALAERLVMEIQHKQHAVEMAA
jgi:predicted nucleotidyltransferase